MTYRGFDLSYDPPSIPCRMFDWQYGRDGEDCGAAETEQEAKNEIDEVLDNV